MEDRTLGMARWLTSAQCTIRRLQKIRMTLLIHTVVLFIIGLSLIKVNANERVSCISIQ